MKRRHFLRNGLWVAGMFPFAAAAQRSLAFLAAADKQGHPPASGGGGGDVTDGVIGSWALDEGTGTTAADSSPTGADASFVGSPSWTTGKSGDALTFSTGNYLSVGTDTTFDLVRPFTLACWVKPGGMGLERYAIFKLGRFGLRMTDSGYIQFVIPGQISATADTNQLTEGVWSFVAAVLATSDNKCHYYFNGTAATEPAFNADGADTGNALLFGYNGAVGWLGELDSLRIYNRALSSTEVQQVYTATGGS